jgi:hypothetical protein
MLACFAVSVVFLASYLTYHANTAAVNRFPAYPPAPIRWTYYLILLTHVVLAAAVPMLALATLTLGLRDRRRTHVRVARWTLPIWLYVSITGVLVYLMLYHWFPAPSISPSRLSGWFSGFCTTPRKTPEVGSTGAEAVGPPGQAQGRKAADSPAHVRAVGLCLVEGRAPALS